jgi:hypothetical protein
MNCALRGNLDRRVLLRAAIAGLAAASSQTPLSQGARAKQVDMNEKRRARYQANSVEIRNFYRVNRYPPR